MTTPAKIWIIDDDHSIRWVLERALSRAEYQTETFESAGQALKELATGKPDAIFSDICMPGMDGFALMQRIHETHPDIPIIIITAHSDLDSAVSAYEGGAYEYLPKPFDVDEAVSLAERAVIHSRSKAPAETFEEPAQVTEIIGEAPSMQEVFRAIGRLTRSNVTVLINGESGTGKELVAQALHRHSPRAAKPFIALNMAAIPRDLLESELFGHEKGAFTGAQAARAGRFEQANDGTLFLDEIGDMPAELQTRLLRVLADGEFYRVGGHTPTKVNVRVIAATHQNLEQMVEQGRFREDLFHRLNVIRIHLPALRERVEDVPQLCDYFLKRAATELSVEPKRLLTETIDYLKQYHWPGNVRQLENICRWITVMASGRDVHVTDLPPELREQPSHSPHAPVRNWEEGLRQWTQQQLENGDSNILDVAVAKFETIMIQTALAATAGKRQEAAKRLGWGRNTLTRKIKELGLD